jgi:hypothetical protein
MRALTIGPTLPIFSRYMISMDPPSIPEQDQLPGRYFNP